MQCSGVELSVNYKEAKGMAQSMASFLRRFEHIWRAHVVEFFQERLWERLDESWIQDLKSASVEDLLRLPSGMFQEKWSSSLKDFLHIARALSLVREPSDNLQNTFPGLQKSTIDGVLSRGMSLKKRHEVELLAASVKRLTDEIHTGNVIDVGAGQGYLAQVLAFEHCLHVVALDASSHHADVTNERAKDIAKHFKSHAKRMGSDTTTPVGPKTITSHVACSDNLHQLLLIHCDLQSSPQDQSLNDSQKQGQSDRVLVGLHACGDLSSAMLRSYVECDEVKAVLVVGCCYNLLSEEGDEKRSRGEEASGFPLSRSVKALHLVLGKRGRDLACQSAERWKDVGVEAAKANFDNHSFRAAFQLVLARYYPDVAKSSPSVGRLGKTRRRRLARRLSLTTRVEDDAKIDAHSPTIAEGLSKACKSLTSDSALGQKMEENTELEGFLKEEASHNASDFSQILSTNNKFAAFEEYTLSALRRLGLQAVERHCIYQIWTEVEPYLEIVGLFWSLRAVLAPVLEAYILIDRLLYLQEEHHHSDIGTSVGFVRLLPLFDPSISPRNMAIIATKANSLKGNLKQEE